MPSPNDFIMVGFVALAVVLSFACRWQRAREQREWAQFHAPLSDDASDLRIGIALDEARTATSACTTCGFQNFSSKTICAMCQTSFVDTKVSDGATHPTRSVREWIRKIDVDGNLFWFRNRTNDTTAWAHYIVRVEPSPQAAARAPTECAAAKVVLEDPAWSDPTVAFSRAWYQTNPQQAQQFVTSQQQSFPARVAEFAVQVQHAQSGDASAETLTTFHLHRETLGSESIEALARLSPVQARGALRVAFVGEPGIDAGGVYREWFTLMNEQLPHPDVGIFTCVDPQNQLFFLNPHSADLSHSLAAGRFVGRALLGGDALGFHLAPPLLKLILGEPVGFPDLASFDPELHRHLQWLVDNDGVDTLGLVCSICEQLPSGEMRAVELVEGGREIAVTDANKREYINAITLDRLVHRVSSQLSAFLPGVYDVVPLESLALFDARELDYVLSGGADDAIDVDDWERHTRYTEDLWHHPTREWFWQIVREMPEDYKKRLLQFATGASRVPLVGFRGLTSYDGRLAPFTLVGRPLADEGFVRSHACFNQLDVPRCVNKNHLKRGLYALLETDVYGFSTA